MVKYTAKRLLQSLITVLVVATIVFLLMRMLPTDYYFTEDQVMKLTEEQKNAQLEAAGLLDPMEQQLGRFYGQLLRLDFGTSRRIQNGAPVLKVIGTKFSVSMRLGCIALVIALLIGVTMGIIQSRNKDRMLDHVGTAYTVFVNAVPPLVSYSLVLAFGANLLNLPALYSTRNATRSSILPIVCLALTSIAHYALWTRRYMVDELNKDYIKLARIKGMSSKNIMVKHVLKNAFVPLVQYIPGVFPFDHQRFSPGRAFLLCSGYGSPADRRHYTLRLKCSSDSGYYLCRSGNYRCIPGRYSDDDPGPEN